MHVTLFMSVSLDGRIARSDGRGDYFTDICWQGFVDVVREKGALVWGRGTHDTVRHWSSFKRDLVGTPVRGLVLTSDTAYATEESWETATSPGQALDKLSRQGLIAAVVAGGTRTNTAFLREGLVSQVILFVEAVIVGEGLALCNPLAKDVRCTLADARAVTDTVARLDLVVKK